MLRSTLVLLATVLVVAPARAAAQTGALDAPSWQARLSDLVSTALFHNPELEAMALDVAAARHRVPQSDGLDVPELELGLRDVPITDPSLQRDDFTMEMVAVRQALPARGERAARRALAQSEVEGVVADHEAHVLDIVADVADAFFALVSVERRLELQEVSRLRLESAAASATERFRVGQAGQADVLRASLESTRLEETVLGLEAERAAQSARLSVLLGQSASAPMPALPAPVLDTLDDELAVPSLEVLERLALARSPEVRTARAAQAVAAAAASLVELESRPDWMLESYYGRRQRFEDLMGVSASVSLPWTRKTRLASKRAEKATEQAAAQAREEAVRARLHGEIRAAYADHELQRKKMRLYRDVIVPQAEIHLSAAREGYTVGRVDFMTFVSAALDLDQYLASAAESAAGVGRAVAALQRASGVPLLPGTPAQGVDHELHPGTDSATAAGTSHEAR